MDIDPIKECDEVGGIERELDEVGGIEKELEVEFGGIDVKEDMLAAHLVLGSTELDIKGS